MGYLVSMLLWIVLCFGTALIAGPRSTAAFLVCYPGTAAVLLGWFLYAGFHSRKRWPDAPYFVRLGKILMFER